MTGPDPAQLADLDAGLLDPAHARGVVDGVPVGVRPGLVYYLLN